jgi:uncharacterized BrkB/YihY/UPF0761 family membrane protein
VMLIITTLLLVVSTLAAGLGSVVGNVQLGVPIGPIVGSILGLLVSLLSAFALFLLVYKILPNAQQGWRDVLPGAALSSLLLIVISQMFPLYVTLFPPNQAYAVFGVFLVFTFWLYLLGFVLVLGAELNAFLLQVRGTAPALQGSGVLGASIRSATAQVGEQGQSATPAPVSRPSLAGRVLGLVGLLVAIVMLRGSKREENAAA